jgi:hypothetical protein
MPDLNKQILATVLASELLRNGISFPSGEEFVLTDAVRTTDAQY